MNRLEKNLQTKVKQWLESRGAVVLKTSPGILNPTGIPDLLALYQGSWCMIEVKSSSTAEHQPLQEIQFTRFKAMNPSLVYEVHPDNWEWVQSLLEYRLFGGA